jgi:hypothetical protein
MEERASGHCGEQHNCRTELRVPAEIAEPCKDGPDGTA